MLPNRDSLAKQQPLNSVSVPPDIWWNLDPRPASPFDEASNDPRSNFLFETGQMNLKKYTIINITTIMTIKIMKNHIQETYGESLEEFVH
ncbi:hypothetical protein HGM15179_010399 [Zosterops borbonicus]|uniref:Uncharacterized protein n=1 Tax=Zosterops borbonicus TaxID=364589 RepID=A0A8K1GDH5_9PASS|nr:hypothetical protein HGM15179_010399 [Zosterops borbonicus]